MDFLVKKGGYFLILVYLSLWVGLFSLQIRIDQEKARFDLEEETFYLPSPTYLKPALLGFDNLGADLFWLQTIQYFGKHYLSDKKYPMLVQLLNLTTSLDPRFIDVYYYGHLFLVYFAKDIQAGISLLKKGVEANPDRWELPYSLASLYFLEMKDYPESLKWFERANRLPGRPHYIPRFVARLYAATGHKETAIDMWMEIYNTTKLSWVRDIAARELKKLGIELPE